MGEVGIPPSAFPRLKWWQVRSIIRGYNRRRRDGWSQTRWHAFNTMQCFADLRKAGINRPTDLIKFPWERVADITVAAAAVIAAYDAAQLPPFQPVER